jgi:hypothetical protein
VPRKLTREHALARFRETHGDQYDYSLVEYVDSRTKVVIVCRNHGRFKQGPSEHWKGQGCPPCARPRQTGAPARPFEKVEPRLIAAHNGKYTYDGSTYRDSNSKIRATCPLHGDFWTQVASHLRGKYGCPKCGDLASAQSRATDYEEWLRLARERYGDRFEYDAASWNTHTNIGLKRFRFRCPDHGWQEMRPDYHLRAPMGCPQCGRMEGGDKRRLTTEEFIARGRARFHGKYTYERTVYRSAAEKLIVTCPEHGDFWTLPNNHTAGHECARCVPGGFDPNLPAIVYYLRIDAPYGALYKIGITNLTVWQRYPYTSDQDRITILREWRYDLGADAAAHEREVLRKYEAYRYSGLPVLLGVGVTEIFTCDVLGLESGVPLAPPQRSLFD